MHERGLPVARSAGGVGVGDDGRQAEAPRRRAFRLMVAGDDPPVEVAQPLSGRLTHVEVDVVVGVIVEPRDLRQQLCHVHLPVEGQAEDVDVVYQRDDEVAALKRVAFHLAQVRGVGLGDDLDLAVRRAEGAVPVRRRVGWHGVPLGHM